MGGCSPKTLLHRNRTRFFWIDLSPSINQLSISSEILLKPGIYYHWVPKYQTTGLKLALRQKRWLGILDEAPKETPRCSEVASVTRYRVETFDVRDLPRYFLALATAAPEIVSILFNI